MKITCLSLLGIFTSTLCFAQTEPTTKKTSAYTYKVGDVFLGLSSGIDHNMNAFRSTATNEYRFEGIENRYNISFDASAFVSERWRPRIELQYHRVAYGQEWSGWQSLDYATFKYTTAGVNYLSLNLHADYLLLGKDSRLKVFVSPGLVTEFASGANYKTEKTDGDTSSSKYSVLGEYYPKSIAGGSVQAIFKYDLNENIGFTLTPGYNAYFRKFSSYSDGRYQRFSLNFGVELRLH